MVVINYVSLRSIEDVIMNIILLYRTWKILTKTVVTFASASGDKFKNLGGRGDGHFHGERHFTTIRSGGAYFFRALEIQFFFNHRKRPVEMIL